MFKIKNTIIQRITQTRVNEVTTLPPILGIRCFTNGSWKDKQGWYSNLEGCDGLLGAKYTRFSLSPLHSKIEALIWAMECKKNLCQYQVAFATEYFRLVKMVSKPKECQFYKLFRRYQDLKRQFSILLPLHIPRTMYSRVDILARCDRKQSTFVIHMDSELPFWFAESS